MAWHYTDDIELKLDFEKREVLYRSSTRLGQTDWDVEVYINLQFRVMLFINQFDVEIALYSIC